MTFHEIFVEGYSSYKEASTVQLPMGITGILGKYEGDATKSNGAGKSSLIMAIVYALYGEGEFSTLDELVNDYSEHMNVRIKFSMVETPGVSYSVERGILKGKSYLNAYADGKPMGSSIPTTQEAIINLLGMDYAMFAASIFFEQGNMDSFIKDSADRRKQIDKITGNDVWTALQKVCNKDINSLDAKFSELTNKIDTLTKSVAAAEVTIATKSKVLSDLQIVTMARDQAQKDLTTLPNMQEVTKKIEVLNTAVASLRGDVKDIQDKMTACKSILAKVAPTDSEFSSYESTIDTLTAKLSVSKASAQDNQTKLSQLERQLLDLVACKAEISSQITVLKNKMSKLQVGICSECQHDVTESYATELKLGFTREITDLTEQLQEKLLEISDKTTEKTQLTTQVKTLQESIEELTKSIATVTSELQGKREEYSRITIEQQQATKDLSDYSQKLTEKTTSLNTALDDLSQLTEISLKVTETTQKMQELQAILTESTEKINKLNQEIGRISLLEEQITKDSQTLSEQQNNLSEALAQKQVYTDALQAAIEIPRAIFETAVVEIEAAANSFINQCDPTLKVRFYEDTTKKSHPLVIDTLSNNKVRSYKRLSGGQKVIVSLGIRLGFSKIIMKKAKTRLQFLVLDEPFGALDQNNRNEVKKILASLTQQFKQIFIITHTNDLADCPNLITVHMDANKCSRIKSEEVLA